MLRVISHFFILRLVFTFKGKSSAVGNIPGFLLGLHILLELVLLLCSLHSDLLKVDREGVATSLESSRSGHVNRHRVLLLLLALGLSHLLVVSLLP